MESVGGKGRQSRVLPLFASVVLAVSWTLTAQTVKEDQNVFMPGSQQGDATLESVNRCDNCHGGYNAAVEPAHNWRGSMMANAARDPLWLATVTVALQDSKHALGNFNAGDLCIRCHSPGGWLAGRSEPTNTSGLTGNDFEGVTCDFCHKMVDPFPALQQRDRPAEIPESAGATAAANTKAADVTMLTPLKLFNGVTAFLNATSQLPTNYGTGSLPDYIEAAGGQFFIDTTAPKRGPRVDANPNHQFRYSRFHRSRYFCATCHDVSNPVVGSMVEGTGTPEEQAAASYGHVERTFSEFMLSAYGQDGGAQTAEKIGVGVAATCQDCHMRDTVGPACNKSGIPVRTDLALHDLTGGNVWMGNILGSADQRHSGYDAYNYAILSGAKHTGASVDIVELQGFGQALFDGAGRAGLQLLQAADLVVVDQSGGNFTLRVVNNTGHKLISGYPEGRRIWLNIVFEGDAGVVGEVNPYTPLVKTTDGGGNDVYVSGGDLTKTHDELVWEANMASTITSEEKTFHFVLATGRYKDNRIPPKGFDIDSAASRMVVPVWHGVEDSSYFTAEEYAGGYDEVTVAIPEGATSATATLYYQTTSKDYMAFLRNEINGSGNTTLPTEAYIAQTDTFFANLKGWGEAMWDLWVHNGGSAPIAMVSTSVEICGAGNEAPTLGDYGNTTVTAGDSTTVTPTAAPSDSDGTVSVAAEPSSGYTGTLSVSSETGVVSIGNANAGIYTVTVTATDNCGATATKTFTLTVQSPPTIVAGDPVPRTAGSSGSTATVATVSDLEDDDGTLTVAAKTVPSGLTVTGISNSNGTVSATVTAACSATPGSNTVTLEVTDSDGLKSTADLTVNVTANPNPTLGDYADVGLVAAGSTTVTPSAAPSDNGTVELGVGASGGFTGSLGVSSETGIVSIGNANVGTFTVTVTATDNCGATTTKSFTLNVTLPAPSGVTATATSSSAVSVTWSSVAGAASYRVYRSSDNGTWSLVGSPSATSISDTGLSASTSYLYKVRSFDGSVESADSVRDLATTVIFTDPVITPGVTNAKAVHVAELRTAVNAVRALAGLTSASFTDATVSSGLTIKAVHVTELRTALDGARSTLGLVAQSYTDPTIGIGSTRIKAAHVTELRDGIR